MKLIPTPQPKVRVKKRDINQGIPANPTYCPIAKAMRRILKGEVQVSTKNCLITYKTSNNKNKTKRTDYIGTLPKKAMLFIARYDTPLYSKVKPFSFKLKLKKVERK